MKHYNQPETHCLTLHTQAMVMQTASPAPGPVPGPARVNVQTMSVTNEAVW